MLSLKHRNNHHLFQYVKWLYCDSVVTKVMFIYRQLLATTIFYFPSMLIYENFLCSRSGKDSLVNKLGFVQSHFSVPSAKTYRHGHQSNRWFLLLFIHFSSDSFQKPEDIIPSHFPSLFQYFTIKTHNYVILKSDSTPFKIRCFLPFFEIILSSIDGGIFMLHSKKINLCFISITQDFSPNQ